MTKKQLLEKINSFYKENIVEVREKKDNYLIIVLSDRKPSKIIDFQKILKFYFKFYKAPPVFLSEKFLKDATDTFPVDIFYIKNFSAHLFGNDLFSDIKLNNQFLRLNCERELRNKLFRIINESSFIKSFNDLFENGFRLLNELNPTFIALNYMINNELNENLKYNYKLLLEKVNYYNENESSNEFDPALFFFDKEKRKIIKKSTILNSAVDLFYLSIEMITDFIDKI